MLLVTIELQLACPTYQGLFMLIIRLTQTADQSTWLVKKKKTFIIPLRRLWKGDTDLCHIFTALHSSYHLLLSNSVWDITLSVTWCMINL